MGYVRIGVSTEEVLGICSDLRKNSSELQTFIEELDALEKDLRNYWEGEDLTTFQTEFAKFKENLEEMPLVVESIAKWGESTVGAYEEATAISQNLVSQVFH